MEAAPSHKLMLADESLSGVDEHEMDHAAELLGRIRKDLNITIIWVEHIMGVLMRVVDRVMVLDHGEKIAEGAPGQVAADPRGIEVYLGTQSGAAPAVAAGPPRSVHGRRSGPAGDGGLPGRFPRALGG